GGRAAPCLVAPEAVRRVEHRRLGPAGRLDPRLRDGRGSLGRGHRGARDNGRGAGGARGRRPAVPAGAHTRIEPPRRPSPRGRRAEADRATVRHVRAGDRGRAARRDGPCDGPARDWRAARLARSQLQRARTFRGARVVGGAVHGAADADPAVRSGRDAAGLRPPGRPGTAERSPVMTLAPDPATVKRALSAHAAIGLLAGALLYIVCLSGSLLVFYEEWQRFEQAAPPQMAAIDPDAVQRGMEALLATERGRTPTTHFYVDLPVEKLPTTRVITDTQSVHLDAEGNLAGPERIEWSNFLYGLHYTLNIPVAQGLVGITIVGILGMLMIALALSGLIAHPKIFRDAFRLRARHNGGVALADWHNRLSVWTLPFTLAIAVTGAVIGLATVASYAISARYYGGDTEAFYATMFGEEGESDAAAAPPPNVAAALRYMEANYPELRLTYVVVHEPGTAGQHVQIVGE